MNKVRLLECSIQQGYIVTEIAHETSSKVKHYERTVRIKLKDKDDDLIYGVKQSIRSILEEINNEPCRD